MLNYILYALKINNHAIFIKNYNEIVYKLQLIEYWFRLLDIVKK
jgi:hypothetical protein